MVLTSVGWLWACIPTSCIVIQMVHSSTDSTSCMPLCVCMLCRLMSTGIHTSHVQCNLWYHIWVLPWIHGMMNTMVMSWPRWSCMWWCYHVHYDMTCNIHVLTVSTEVCSCTPLVLLRSYSHCVVMYNTVYGTTSTSLRVYTYTSSDRRWLPTWCHNHHHL